MRVCELMYTSCNSHGRVLLIDGVERRRGGRSGPRVTSDLWECQQVAEPKKNTAAAAALNQPQRLT